MSRIARLSRLFHKQSIMAGAAVSMLAIGISHEAKAQRKGGLAGGDEATSGQPAAGIAPGIPGGAGRPGFGPGGPGGGESQSGTSQGPAKVPSFKAEPRHLPGAVVDAPANIIKGAPFNTKAYFGMPAEKDNAGPLVLDALAELPDVYRYVAKDEAGLKERVDRLNAANEWFQANPNPRQWDANAIEPVFGPYRVLFAKLHEAHKLPECVIPTGMGPTALLPHMQASNAVVSLVSPLIFADLARGDKKGAIEKFADTLRLGQDLQIRAGSVSSMVVTNIHMKMLTQVLPILLNSRLNEKDCDAILAALKNYRENSINLLPEMIKTEYLSQLTAMESFSKPGTFKTMISQLPEPPANMKGVNLDQVDAIVSAIFSPENLDKLRTGMAKATADILKAFDSVSSPADMAKLGDSVNQINKKAASELLGSLFTKENLAAIAAKAGAATKGKEGAGNIDPSLLTNALSSQSGLAGADFKPVVDGVIQFQTAQSMMEALTATRRWYVTKKASAKDKTLEEIAKEAKLEGAPLDGFSGKPLKMVWIGSGPAVYSVGPDRKDDGAKALFGAVGENQKPSATGDWIVPLALGANPLAAAQEGGSAGPGGPGGPGGGYPGAPGIPGGPGGPGGRRGGGGGGLSAGRPD